ncbi:MAG: S9 family peptidase [Flavobacteriales bacterium]
MNSNLSWIPALFLSVLWMPTTAQTGSELLTNEKIWYSGTFRSEGVWGIRSMKDGKHYTSSESTDHAGTAIVKYAYASGEAVDTLATSLTVFGDAGIRMEGYSFSPAEDKLMIWTETEPLYRHSFSANYHVHDLSSQSTQPLSDFTLGLQRLARFSPAADKIAFVRNNNVFISDLTSGVETQVTTDGMMNQIINGASDWVYEEEFGKDNGIFWSADGNHLAYYRFDESAVKEFGMPMYGQLYPDPYVFKYPKAGEDNSQVSIQVYHLNSGSNDVIATPEVEYIPRVKWTPDDNRLLVMTMNRHQNDLKFELADMTQSKGGVIQTETVWSEQNETFIDITVNLTFLTDDTFLFTSGRSGYNHLWQGGFHQADVQITEGEWDISRVYGFDNKRKQIYFEGSMKGATQLHLARTDLKGKVTLLDEAPGHHGGAFSRTFDYCIHNHSDANTPPTYTLRNRKWNAVRTLKDNAGLKAELAAHNVQPKTFFTFTNSAGVELNCWMIKPPHFDPTQLHPVYVAIYGGPGVQTVEDNYGGSTYLWHQMLAQKGYIVVSCDPRGTPMRGKGFEHSTYKELGKLETEDFIDFGRYLAAQPFVDAKRIGIQGWSYGGFMTLLSMTKGADVYSAGISVAPVSNWRYYDTIYTERFMQTPQENPSGYDENSPVNHAEKLEGKLLLVHGSADDNVHFQNAMEMVNALVAADKQFDFFAYPNRNHGIYGGNTRLHLFEMMLEFVEENL